MVKRTASGCFPSPLEAFPADGPPGFPGREEFVRARARGVQHLGVGRAAGQDRERGEAHEEEGPRPVGHELDRAVVERPRGGCAKVGRELSVGQALGPLEARDDVRCLRTGLLVVEEHTGTERELPGSLRGVRPLRGEPRSERELTVEIHQALVEVREHGGRDVLRLPHRVERQGRGGERQPEAGFRLRLGPLAARAAGREQRTSSRSGRRSARPSGPGNASGALKSAHPERMTRSVFTAGRRRTNQARAWQKSTSAPRLPTGAATPRGRSLRKPGGVSKTSGGRRFRVRASWRPIVIDGLSRPRVEIELAPRVKWVADELVDDSYHAVEQAAKQLYQSFTLDQLVMATVALQVYMRKTRAHLDKKKRLQERWTELARRMKKLRVAEEHLAMDEQRLREKKADVPASMNDSGRYRARAACSTSRPGKCRRAARRSTPEKAKAHGDW